ncbi:MAG: hypothetical protein AAF533_01495 [Acidobacteriota bacterium]
MADARPGPSRSARLVGIGLLASLVLLGSCAWGHHRRLRDDDAATRAQAAANADRAVTLVTERMSRAQSAARAVADALDGGIPSDERLADRLRQVLLEGSDVVRAAVAFDRFAHPSGHRLHAVALERVGGRIRALELDGLDDYTTADWFTATSDASGRWHEPTLTADGQRLLARFVLPFHGRDATGERRRLGVVVVALSGQGLGRALDRLGLGESGYLVLSSEEGRWLLHPDRTLLDGRPLGDEAPWRDRLRRGADVAPAPLEDHDPLTHQPAWFLHRGVEPAGWSLVHVFLRSESPRQLELRRSGLRLALAGLLVLGMLLGVLVTRYPGEGYDRWWWLALGVAALFAIGTALTCNVARDLPPSDHHDDRRVTNRSSLDRLLRECDETALAAHRELPLHVPTGVFLQSITFVGSNDVRLTGYLWQKYRDGVHDDVQRGFLLPEAESFESEEIYRLRTDDVELIGWSFKVVLHQEFDYSRYPFDQENVWLQLWHRDFHRNVILVPDLDSYQTLAPASLPGIEEDPVLPGWDIRRSYFSYRLEEYSTSFGFPGARGLRGHPELYFNVIIRKHLIGPFVSHLMPLSVILILLYTILMVVGRSSESRDALGFDTLGVVGACAGFFLVVVFAHVGLRDALAAQGFVYLEYYYFLTYAMILGISVNALLVLHPDADWLHYRDNMMPKLLYWPVSQGALFAVTLWSLT